MSLKEVKSLSEMKSGLVAGRKNYLLLYKKGSEVSDCSYQSLSRAVVATDDVNVMAANVAEVRDIHPEYQITSAPSLMIFEGKDFLKSVKGCNDDAYSKSLFESSLFSAKQSKDKQANKRVTVYTTPTCSWCTTIKKHLDRNGIRYKEIDVSKDQQAAEAMVKKSGQQGVPQTDINGQMIIGFDKVRINSLLGIQ